MIEISRYIGEWLYKNRQSSPEATLELATDMTKSSIIDVLERPEVMAIFTEAVIKDDFFYITPIEKNINEVENHKFYRYQYTSSNSDPDNYLSIYTTGTRLLERYELFDKSEVENGHASYRLYEYDSYTDMYEEMCEECFYRNIEVGLLNTDLRIWTIFYKGGVLYKEMVDVFDMSCHFGDVLVEEDCTDSY